MVKHLLVSADIQVPITKDKEQSYSNIMPLSEEEQKVFLVLYTEEKPIPHFELARRLGISVSLLRSYITSMIEKGVPIQKAYFQRIPHISLEKNFKAYQAKKNIIDLRQTALRF